MIDLVMKQLRETIAECGHLASAEIGLFERLRDFRAAESEWDREIAWFAVLGFAAEQPCGYSPEALCGLLHRSPPGGNRHSLTRRAGVF